MGPCQSIIDMIIVPLPGSGPYDMNSEESRSFLTSDATFDSNGNEKFAGLVELRGGSHALAKGFNLSPGGQFNVFKYVNKKECKITKDALPLDGANIDVSGGELQLWYAQGAPIAMPVACFPVGGGSARAVLPAVFAIDLYVEVDGTPHTDGFVCYGTDPSLSKEKAIAAAVNDNVYGEHFMADLLTKGPGDGSKPWATLVRKKRWSDSDGHIYVPLMANDVDNAMMGDEDLTYVHSLLAKWAQLLGKVGSGQHSFTISLRPRGCIFNDDGSPYYDSMGGGGMPNEVLNAQISATLIGEHLSAIDAPGMSASFTMTLGADQVSGQGPVRKAQEFESKWPEDEIEECIELAMGFANKGVCGAMAKTTAKNSGRCCHIILTEGEAGAGIRTAKFGNNEREYDYFLAWALFKNKDGKPGSLGAQVKFSVKKDKILNFRPVDADWRSAGFEFSSSEIATGLTITNAEIDAAIARDAKYY